MSYFHAEAERRRRKDVTAKIIGKFWRSPFSGSSSMEEKLGVYVPQIQNARQALGFDVYAAKSLERLGVCTPEELYEYFLSRRENNLFQKTMKNNGLSSEQISNVVLVLQNMFSNISYRREVYAAANKHHQRSFMNVFRHTSSIGSRRNLVPASPINEVPESDIEWEYPLELFMEVSEGELDEKPSAACFFPNPLRNTPRPVDSTTPQKSPKQLEGLSSTPLTNKVKESMQSPKLEPLSARNPTLPKDTLVGYSRTCTERGNFPRSRVMQQLVANSKCWDLHGQELLESELPSIFNNIKALKQLTQLDLSHNNIGAVGAALFTETINRAHCPLLVRLKLGHCNLGHSGAESICIALAGMEASFLEFLDLENNQTGDRLALTLVNISSGLRWLKTLVLSNNDIQDAGMIALAKLCNSETCKLTALDVSWNKIGPIGAQVFFKDFSRSSSLLHLSLGWNHIQDIGAIAAAEAITTQCSLRKIEMQENRISAVAAEFLGEAVQRATILEYLDVSFNSIGYTGIKAIINGLLNNKLQAVKVVNLLQCWTPPRKQPLPEECMELMLSKRYQMLKLDEPTQHGIAVLLVEDHLSKKIGIRKPKLNGLKFNRISRSTISRKPVSLEFDVESEAFKETGIYYVSVKEFYSQLELRTPTLHVTADLALREDKETVILLVDPHYYHKLTTKQNVAFNPNEFQDFRYDGAAIGVDFEWILQRNAGVLEFKLNRENLRLGIKTNANCMYPEELRKLAAAVKENLHTQWVEGLHVIATIDSAPTHTKQVTSALLGGRKRGFIPGRGILEFEFLPMQASRVLTQRFVFDLSDSFQRRKAIILQKRERETIGEGCLSCRLNQKVIHNFKVLHFVQLANEKGEMPTAGIVDLSYLVTRPVHIVKQMMVVHKKIDLGFAEGWRHAMFLRHFAIHKQESLTRLVFWKAVTLDGRDLDFADVAYPELWDIPFEGVLEFDYVSYHGGRRASSHVMSIVLENLKSASSDCDRLEFLKGLEFSEIFINIEQLEQVVDCFEYAQDKPQAYKVLVNRIINPHESENLEDALAIELRWTYEATNKLSSFLNS